MGQVDAHEGLTWDTWMPVGQVDAHEGAHKGRAVFRPCRAVAPGLRVCPETPSQRGVLRVPAAPLLGGHALFQSLLDDTINPGPWILFSFYTQGNRRGKVA